MVKVSVVLFSKNSQLLLPSGPPASVHDDWNNLATARKSSPSDRSYDYGMILL